MNWPRIEGIIYSEEDKPHDILGPHAVGKSVVFQTFQPGAEAVSLVVGQETAKHKMEMVDEAGYFACVISGKIPEEYVYEVTGKDGELKEVKDAYRYCVGLSDKDIDKFNAGIHYSVYEKLGAHLMEVDGIMGTFFAVWAPNALRVSVVGDFNGWDGRIHQMRRNEQGGIFEIFIPDVHEGECYKYEIKVKGGLTFLKADPYAFGQQLRPETASVVRDISAYKWKDQSWMKDRAVRQGVDSPISVYELYLGSFRRNADTNEYLNYRELAFSEEIKGSEGHQAGQDDGQGGDLGVLYKARGPQDLVKGDHGENGDGDGQADGGQKIEDHKNQRDTDHRHQNSF